MNILILGSGGREHALAWKIKQSKKLGKLYIAPGNAGTGILGENVDIAPTDFSEIGDFCISHNINMLVVGPEEPLVRGISNFFSSEDRLKHIPVIGPSKEGAMLEGSKDFAKTFMKEFSIPTAAYKTFTSVNIEEGYAFLEELRAPYVIKADGLAAGKGVLILNNLEEAKHMLRETLGGKFGEAGNKVVIEEYLHGIELSTFVLTDGISYKLLPEAKDYKRIGEGDTGPNTGGMGAVSPVPFADKTFLDKVCKRIIEPTLKGLKQRDITYKGFIFIGLMNVNGDPYVIEYNVRMGDPETEVIIPRLDTDLLDLFEGVAHQTLAEKSFTISPETAVTVVCVSGGYPDGYTKGFPISGLDKISDSIVFHAGTKHKDNATIAAGGRVLAITSLGHNITDALRKSYQSISSIKYEGMYMRRDIGQDLL
ncbi:MAG: phosphoribosylamine--glycine ligase [Prevotellaceae bacterium]|jgi:phosphoribosylamine--glycine ligase|nr:phosphoribosylamine--glycine ligase [Prevotellaceae bacterium]